MAPRRANESSRSFDGVGSVLRVDGGGRGFLGPPYREPDMAEPALGLPHAFDTEEPGRGP